MTKQGKPNILILQGDDIGWWNISYNSRGQMGYHTPSIDRVANEGVAFTDYYARFTRAHNRKHQTLIGRSLPLWRKPSRTKVKMSTAQHSKQSNSTAASN